MSQFSRCRKKIIRESLFTEEAGDKNGPRFSKDYVRYYHLGISPDGAVLDLDLYYRLWYNPIRWMGGPR